MKQSISQVGMGNILNHDLNLSEELEMFGTSGKFDSNLVELFGSSKTNNVVICTRGNKKTGTATVCIHKDQVDELIEFLQKSKDL